MLFLYGFDVLREVVRVISGYRGSRLLLLYGSVARGDYGPDSDIDLVLVFEGDPEGVRRDVLDVSVKYNVPVSLRILTPSEYFHSGSSFVSRLRREGVLLWTCG